jgi:hypothetical protein
MHNGIGTCDSRPYRVGYELNSFSDIPEGFCIPSQAGNWRKAIFVPGDRQNGWRTTYHLPRIYILTQKDLTIYPHPDCGEQPFAAPLDELMTLTSHMAPLFGTVELSTLCSDGYFRYDPVHQRCMRSLLSALRIQWLPIRATRSTTIDLKQLDPPLELRCRYALELELDTEESILSLSFQPKTYRKTHACFIPGKRLPSVSCLVVTNRRIMTIASRNGHDDEHGAVTIRYAALANAANAEVERHDDGFSLKLKLRNDRVWKIGLPTAQAASVSRMLEFLRCG